MKQPRMKSAIVKRSIVIGGHKTSISLEEIFWDDLKRLAELEKTSLSGFVGKIDAERRHANLSSVIRVYLYTELRRSNEALLDSVTAAARELAPVAAHA